MKKILLAAAFVAMGLGSANAQTGLQTSKFLDNWYLGAKAGVSTPLTFNHTFPLNPNFGIKLGKNFSPVFGANIEALAGFGDNQFVAQVPEHMVLDSKTFVKTFNLGLNGTINWTNLFLGYNENKVFHFGTEAGIGWGTYFGDRGHINDANNWGDNDDLTAKTSLTFTWDLGGAAKPWQIYVELSSLCRSASTTSSRHLTALTTSRLLTSQQPTTRSTISALSSLRSLRRLSRL